MYVIYIYIYIYIYILRKKSLHTELSWSEYEKMGTRDTPNKDTFHAVIILFPPNTK